MAGREGNGKLLFTGQRFSVLKAEKFMEMDGGHGAQYHECVFNASEWHTQNGQDSKFHVMCIVPQ